MEVISLLVGLYKLEELFVSASVSRQPLASANIQISEKRLLFIMKYFAALVLLVAAVSEHNKYKNL